MVAVKKNSSSVAVATRDGETLYLSETDIIKGLDVQFDMQGYTINAL